MTAESAAAARSEIRGADLHWKSRTGFQTLFLPSAHLGHWYVQLAFAAPALAGEGRRAPGEMSRLLALAAVMLGLLPPGLAGADGDPASDVLLGQGVFLPYSSISQPVERRLYAVTQAARHTGQPLKIALVGARTDLGVVTALFGRPGPTRAFSPPSSARCTPGRCWW